MARAVAVAMALMTIFSVLAFVPTPEPQARQALRSRPARAAAPASKLRKLRELPSPALGLLFSCAFCALLLGAAQAGASSSSRGGPGTGLRDGSPGASCGASGKADDEGEAFASPEQDGDRRESPATGVGVHEVHICPGWTQACPNCGHVRHSLDVSGSVTVSDRVSTPCLGRSCRKAGQSTVLEFHTSGTS